MDLVFKGHMHKEFEPPASHIVLSGNVIVFKHVVHKDWVYVSTFLSVCASIPVEQLYI